MKISIPLIAFGSLLSVGSLFAQVPVISYASSPASLLISTAVGTTPNPTLAVTSTGGNVGTHVATTFAGSTSGTAGTTNATGTTAKFSGPRGITVAASGNFYIADQTNNEVRKITSAGVVTLLAGSTTGLSGLTNGATTSVRFNSPRDVTTDNTSIFIADYGNNEIRQSTSSGTVSLLAGSSTGASGTTDGTTTAARFNGPAGIVYSTSATALYVSDYNNNSIRLVTTAGVVTTFAGSTSGASGMANATGTSASFNHPVGLAVDASGNVYVADQGNNQVRKITSAGVVTLLAGSATGIAGSADGTGSTATFNSPSGIAIDANGLLYVYDTGTGLLRSVTSAGVVTTVAGAGTTGYVDATGASAKFNGGGLICDASNNVFIADFGNNTMRKITITGGYSVSPALPTGLTLNTTTGAITGTPSASTTPTNYTITAANYDGSSAATLNLNVYSKKAWDGSTDGTWGTSANWTPSGVPTTWDQVTIGSTTAYSSLPTIPTGSTINIGSIIMGTSDNGTPASITVNGTGILNVTNDITYQSDASSLTKNAFVATLAGTGTINAKNLNITANTVLNSYTLKLTSSITNLNISGDINLTTTYTSGSQIDNSTFTISGGTVRATDLITTNGTSSTSTLAMTGGTLNFTDPTALAGLSGTGTNTLTLSAGSTIGYTASGAQTVYTNSAITGLPSGISYQNLSLSGSGIKTAPSGTLNIAGNFTNTLANDAGNYLDVSGATVSFNGTAAQALAGGSGNGTKLYNTIVTGNSTKTMSSGLFSIESTGSLTLSSNGILGAGGLLTLRSDANNSAYVAQIPSGSSVTGNVNVQRYISGGILASRGYRLLSSPVSLSSSNLYYPNLDFIKNGMYTTGTNGVTNGFNSAGNPTMYIYREDIQPNFNTFISGNFRGVAKINSGASFTIDADGAGFNIFAGNGVLTFFRGDPLIANPTSTSTIPSGVTLTSTGYLNQGNVVVKNWFTPASSNLSFTSGTDASVQGFNLVGNPYASSIDWDLVYTGGNVTNIDNKIYVYNPYCKCYSTYKAGDLGVGTSTNGSGNNSDILPAGQGFFVRTTNTGATLTFAETHKTTTQKAATNTMLATAVTPQTIKYLRIQLKKDADNMEDALVFFSPDASANYITEEDGQYLRGNNTLTISTVSANNVNLAINHLAFPSAKTLVIPVNATISVNGAYQLNLTEAVNIPAGYKIWLKDSFLADSVNIQNNPTYNFNALTTDSATFGKKRFSLVVRQDDAYVYKLLEFTATKAFAKVDLKWKTQNAVGNYLSYNVERSIDGGNTFEILGTVPVSGTQNDYSFADRSPKLNAQNIYRLKQEGDNSQTIYSEWVDATYSSIIGGMVKNQVNAYPNPTRSTIGLLIVDLSNKLNTTNADYAITITNGMGSVIKTFTTKEPYVWQGDVSAYSPGTYFVQVVNNNTKTIIGNSKFVKL